MVDTFGTWGAGTARSLPSETFYSVLKASVPGGRMCASGPCSLTSLKLHWAYSSVGLEHTPDKREVGSSNLPRPTNQVVGERWKVTGGKPAPTPVT